MKGGLGSYEKLLNNSDINKFWFFFFKVGRYRYFLKLLIEVDNRENCGVYFFVKII